MSTISSHADHRYQDYHFERTQSRTFQALKWKTATPPLRSWSNYIYPALFGVSGIALFVAMVH